MGDKLVRAPIGFSRPAKCLDSGTADGSCEQSHLFFLSSLFGLVPLFVERNILVPGPRFIISTTIGWLPRFRRHGFKPSTIPTVVPFKYDICRPRHQEHMTWVPPWPIRPRASAFNTSWCGIQSLCRDNTFIRDSKAWWMDPDQRRHHAFPARNRERRADIRWNWYGVRSISARDAGNFSSMETFDVWPTQCGRIYGITIEKLVSSGSTHALSDKGKERSVRRYTVVYNKRFDFWNLCIYFCYNKVLRIMMVIIKPEEVVFRTNQF